MEMIIISIIVHYISFTCYGLLTFCLFTDIWKLKDVPTGELPRNMFLSIDHQLVQTIVPGTRLTIMGIYSIFQAANSSTS